MKRSEPSKTPMNLSDSGDDFEEGMETVERVTTPEGISIPLNEFKCHYCSNYDVSHSGLASKFKLANLNRHMNTCKTKLAK